MDFEAYTISCTVSQLLLYVEWIGFFPLIKCTIISSFFVFFVCCYAERNAICDSNINGNRVIVNFWCKLSTGANRRTVLNLGKI